MVEFVGLSSTTGGGGSNPLGGSIRGGSAVIGILLLAVAREKEIVAIVRMIPKSLSVLPLVLRERKF